MIDQFRDTVSMKILQVSTFFNQLGGVEKAVSDLSSSLSDSYDVEVLCTGTKPTHRFQFSKVLVTSAGGRIAPAGRPISADFCKLISQYEVDVAHYHLPCPMAVFADVLASPKAKYRIATWHHDTDKHPLLHVAMRPFLDRFLNRLDAIVVTSPRMIDHTPALKKFRSKCHVIPLGIDERRFDAVRDGQILDIRERYGSPLILYVGRLVYYKGCDLLLEAMKSVPTGQLIMIGTGPLKSVLENRIVELGLQDRVHLLGWQTDDFVADMFKACDLFVLPSTTPTECFGLVQVEAMMSARPVINTNLITGVPWVSVDKETGLTVEPGNALELAAAINKLVNDPVQRKVYGNSGRERSLKLFTIDAQRLLTHKLYTDLVSKTIKKQPTVAV